MARLTGENIEQFSTGGGRSRGGYFSLKNDKETATVRFLYEKASDIEGFTVHRVPVGDRERYVNCISDKEECPFCRAKLQRMVKIFVPLLNEDADQIQTWERGQKFYGKLAGLFSRYPNLVSRTFDVERNGKKGDTGTTYEIYPVGEADGTTLDDILEDYELQNTPSPLGTIILQKSADDMEYYLSHDGEFPEGNDVDDVPVRRRGRAEEPADLPFETGEEEEKPRRGARGRSRY